MVENRWSWGGQLFGGILLFLIFLFLNVVSYDETTSFKIMANLILALLALVTTIIALGSLKVLKQRIKLTHPLVLWGTLAAISMLIMLGFNKTPQNIVLALQSKNALLATTAALSTAIFEESICRGLFLSAFLGLETYLEVRRKHNHKMLKAALFSALLFGILHIVNLFGGNAQSVFQQIFYTFAAGVFLAALRIATNNLLWPILLHFLIDWAPLEFYTTSPGSGWLIMFTVFVPMLLLSAIFLVQVDRQFLQTEPL
ncbi:metal-dependent membrane protease [Agrilactobacillus composti DSM 18527 = JCM 14202]|uniref:Metal-dependent membrane protease n=1 Tax=Agrilactobacillus composti DSM 18527 = JCM 14202 TaxID=1423734 RepID=X0PW19_9LACO|nr:CPBP family intramembrane glutamic endopeptidase [Agrilactobacillus composti]KRM33406.1 metal-dependent membrane protease [Agrilactobacillus composti DSM 18527 = JCM 14202]GAF41751.1 predicted metal-dependent membrane protease [Agrilactobacillus composti DSM 18527 = JCM 14202]